MGSLALSYFAPTELEHLALAVTINIRLLRSGVRLQEGSHVG